MGDLVSPRRRDVYDRLRRRIEQYRRHHQVRLDRVSEPPANNGLYEHQRQETLLLQQRWLESKAKRAAKNSKSSRDPNSQHNNNQLSKLKRKLDSQNNITSEGLPPVGIDHYKFEDQSSPPLKKQCHGGGPHQQQQHQQQEQQGKTTSEAQHCVSVNIDLQQISNSQSIETSQTSQIQLTVKSTLHTGGGGGAQNNATSSSTSASVSTNTICKQEPEHAQASSNQVQQDLNNQHSNSNSSQNSIPDSIGFDDVEFDELNDILNQLEKEEGGLPPELLKELDLGRIPVDGQHQDAHPPQSHQVKQDTNNQQHQQDYNKVNSSSANNPLYFAGDSANAASSHVHVKKGSPGPGMFADPIYDNSNVSANPNSYGMGGPAGAASMTAYARPPTGHGPAAGPSPPLGAAHGEVPPPLPPLGDTGPAAETLKQMAAQHQSQDGYMKVGGAVSYAAEGYHDGYRRQMSYPGGYTSPNYPMSVSVTQQGGAMYPYNHQMAGRAPYMGAPAAAQGNMGMKTEMGTYGATKPLTHFSPGSSPSPSATGSSLQRLQNQVQSHFSQAPSHQGMPAGPSTQMQISQSQQMHMSSQQAGHASMHFSQSQHMQIHTSGASVNGPPPNITMAQQQSFSMGPQYGAMTQQMYQEKMRQDDGGGGMQGSAQYMNRPPPTYPQQQAQQSGMASSNPLQTMQNMVNQTSPNVPPNGGQSGPNGGTGEMYAATGIKTEGISRGQQHSMSAGARESPQPVPPAVGAATGGGYPPRPPPQMMAAAQQQQQQQMVNGGVVGRSSTKTEQSTYTSALMRGQRPPNVNVGPDGLNISQQRPPDWPRHMMAGGAGGHPGHMARPPPPQGGMMQYGGYNNPAAAAMQGARMHMAQHQQAMAMQQRGMGGGGGMGGMPPHQGMRAPHPHMQHMMMGQHQQMHMQNGGQQQAMAMGISQTSAMGVTGNSQPPHSVTQQQQGGHYPPHSTAQNPPGGAEFSLDFLDSTNGEGPNFFDSNASDFNFIEDILSSK